MTLLLQICLLLAILFLIVVAGWRLISRRSSLPCPSWLAWLVEVDNPLAKDYSAGSIVRRLELRPGMRVLDAGCGPGRITIPLARALGSEGEVVAIDVQPRMLQRAAARSRMAGVTNIKFLELPIGAGKIERDRYDRILLVAVLGEIPDRGAALGEIFYALVPGGILSISEIIADPHYQSHDAILKLALPLGFHERAFFGNRFAYTLHLEKPESAV
jgi:ubiquinone/menaquinone biosynthesis C-methylase UbiE